MVTFRNSKPVFIAKSDKSSQENEQLSVVSAISTAVAMRI
jgi:hypothetical protein